jgi:hypothetical protein
MTKTVSAFTAICQVVPQLRVAGSEKFDVGFFRTIHLSFVRAFVDATDGKVFGAVLTDSRPKPALSGSTAQSPAGVVNEVFLKIIVTVLPDITLTVYHVLD